MASSHTDLEMVTVRGVTFLIDPSTFVEGCTYLLVGSGTVEPFDSVPVPSAALLLNLGRGGSTPEERDRSLQVGDLLLGTMGQRGRLRLRRFRRLRRRRSDCSRFEPFMPCSGRLPVCGAHCLTPTPPAIGKCVSRPGQLHCRRGRAGHGL